MARGAELVDAQGEGLPVEVIKAALRPAACLRTKPGGGEAVGASRFGGMPDLPPDFPWPRWEGFTEEDLHLPPGAYVPRAMDPGPLSFLAQLDLASIPDPEGRLPATGLLSFFFDAWQQPDGRPWDRGAARVLYFEDTSAVARASAPDDLHEELRFAERGVTCEVMATLPLWAFELGLKLPDPGDDRYWELASQIAGPAPYHRLGGWPALVQNEMQLECQLASNGVYCGRREDYERDEVKRLAPGASDWTLLLQIDTDDEASGPGWMWCDSGSLYFWIRRQDLEARRFDKVWTILQSC
ncbi:MAG: DUF1963 domain-containing protein [Polyangiaceae bacterium]|nr:DUF1963 domain-containing protein [Polyangiaceae bacterium]